MEHVFDASDVCDLGPGFHELLLKGDDHYNYKETIVVDNDFSNSPYIVDLDKGARDISIDLPSGGGYPNLRVNVDGLEIPRDVITESTGFYSSSCSGKGKVDSYVYKVHNLGITRYFNIYVCADGYISYNKQIHDESYVLVKLTSSLLSGLKKASIITLFIGILGCLYLYHQEENSDELDEE